MKRLNADEEWEIEKRHKHTFGEQYCSCGASLNYGFNNIGDMFGTAMCWCPRLTYELNGDYTWKPNGIQHGDSAFPGKIENFPEFVKEIWTEKNGKAGWIKII